MKTTCGTVTAALVAAIAAVGSASEDAARRGGGTEAELLGRAGARGRALVLVLGAADTDRLLAMARSSRCLFHVLDPDAGRVRAAREAAFAAGLYGARIIAERCSFDRLPHADRLCDAVLAPGLAAGKIAGDARAEILRVLRPGGVALLGPGGGERLQAPADPELHDWSHWRSTAGNWRTSPEPTAPPFLMQWFSSDPFYAHAPNVLLASGGRAFFVSGDMYYGANEGCEPRTIHAYGGHNGMELWKRALADGEAVQWPGYVATADVFYLAGEKGCVALDPQTGEELLAFRAPAGTAGAWKWIGAEGDRLYALLGQEEKPASMKSGLQDYWGAGPALIKAGANKFGSVFAAFARSDGGRALWTRTIEHAAEGRSVAMCGGRIFYRAAGKEVGCLEAGSGKVLWANRDASVMETVEATANSGGTSAPFRTDASGVATEQVYLTTSRRKNVVAFSAADGRVLWSRGLQPEGVKESYVRSILVFPDHLLLYVPTEGTRKGYAWNMVDALTGRSTGTVMGVDRDKPAPLTHGSCTVDTAGSKAIFDSRSWRVTELEGGRTWSFGSVRSSCSVGTVLGNGLAHVTPGFCRCGYSLDGVKAFAAAGAFDFGRELKEEDCLEVGDDPAVRKPLDIVTADWPAWRANSARTAATTAGVPREQPGAKWEYKLESGLQAGAPVAAGGLVFVGGADGVVRALDGASGSVRWTCFTGGAVMSSPALAEGRAFFGSCDGRVYALEAATGRLLWRFRVAPVERRMGFQNSIASTWPVAGDVVAGDGLVVAAAGILDISGSYVCALDAASGRVRWQVSTARHLARGNAFSVTGPLSAAGGRLFLPAGPSYGGCIRMFDLKDGKALGGLGGSRGRGVAVLGGLVYSGGQDFFGRSRVSWSVGSAALPGSPGVKGVRSLVLPAGTGERLLTVAPLQRKPVARSGIIATAPQTSGTNTLWTAALPDEMECDALVLAGGAVLAAVSSRKGVAAAKPEILAFKAEDGAPLWRTTLPDAVLPECMAVDRDGRIIVSLHGGRVVCLAGRR